LKDRRKQLRIVLAATEYSWPNYAGGIKSYTRVLAKSLVHSGHEVHIITTAVEGKECQYVEEGIIIHCVEPGKILPGRGTRRTAAPIQVPDNQSGISDLLGAFHLLRRSIRVRAEVLHLARNSQVDIVELPDWNAEGFWLTLRPFVPVVVVLHGPRFLSARINGLRENLGVKASERLEKQAILGATAVVSPSLAMANAAVKEYNAPWLKAKITVIPNPIDTTLFSPVTPANREDRGQPLWVTYVGRLEFQKGLHLLVKAVPEIKREHPDVRFKFVGGDTQTAPGGGSMQSYLSQQLQQYEDAVEFTGPLPQHELPAIYSDSAVVVMPSYNETFGLVCAEAMSCGTCVVASRVGGIPEIIQDRKTGFLIPPGDAEALAQSVNHLLKYPQERQQIGANARGAIVQSMSIERITEQKIRVYEQIAASHK
jgi:glycosyltransferase involved in cell wall biosynthesis